MRSDGKGVLVNGVDQLQGKDSMSQEVVPIAPPMGSSSAGNAEAGAVRKTELLRK